MIWHWFVMSLWIFWLMVYWRGGLDILQDIRNAASRVDLLSLVALTIITLALVGICGWISLQAGVDHPLAPVGAGLAACGVAGTFYCRRFLGKFWTAENALQPNHRIVNTGPYAYVRHPIYTAAILLYLGTGLAFPVWENVLLALFAGVVYVLKTAHEDDFLSVHLPGYTSYKEQVRYRLLPGVW